MYISSLTETEVSVSTCIGNGYLFVFYFLFCFVSFHRVKMGILEMLHTLWFPSGL